MRLLSALFDVVLLPLALGRDCIDISNWIDGEKSYTRQKIEKIEDELR